MSNKAFKSNNDFSHQAVADHFKKQKFYGYESELSYLDFFLKKKKEEKDVQEIRFSDSYGNNNTPLIVTGDEGCGKTSLVVQWIKTLTNPPRAQVGQTPINRNHVILYHFAGVSNCDLKYQSFIFRALVKLRQEYDIQHRVEIIDDKLRMNFARWLELASQKHEERLDPESKVILVLDGLENFKDVDTQGEESADWIPWTFPNHIKVILMTKKNSKAMNHFKLRKYPIIYMSGVSPSEIQQMLDDYINSDQGKQISQRLIDNVKQEIFQRLGANYNGDSFINLNGQMETPILDKNHSLATPYQNKSGDDDMGNQKPVVEVTPMVPGHSGSQPGFSLFSALKGLKPQHSAEGSNVFSKSIHGDQQQKPDTTTPAQHVNPLKSFMSQGSSVSTALKYFVRKNYLKNIVVPADQCEMISQPFLPFQNPLIIKCILNFHLVFNKYESKDEELFRLMPLNLKAILDCKSLKSLFVMAINHFRSYLFSLSHQSHNHQEEMIKFDYLLGYIYVSRKGITRQELLELIPSLSEQQLHRFLSIFGFLLVKEQEQIFFKHSSFKKAVKECVSLISNEDQKIILHRNLSMVIEKEFFSLRQIDELSHQYFMGKCWIKLKDLISNIEVFSIMFVPEIKHELASYWQCLEQHKYDPVAEYNKALEGFVVKYRPNNQELFVILIQLSRFFKELADLETKYTPQFKHPPLRGQSELESITLLGELQKLDDLYNPQANSTAVGSLASEPLLGDVEHFNVDNTIVREQIMAKIKRELEEQKIEKTRDSLGVHNQNGKQSSSNGSTSASGQTQIYYYYKRWIWVQFPWCTIDVYSNLSNIMEMSMGSHTNYISTAKENELVNGTIQILKEAKLRKKNNRAALTNGNNTANQSMNKSRLQGGRSQSPSRSGKKLQLVTATPLKMVLRNNMHTAKKSTAPLINTQNPGGTTLPPLGPQTAKNSQAANTSEVVGKSFMYQSRLQRHNQQIKSRQDQYRSTSAGIGGTQMANNTNILQQSQQLSPTRQMNQRHLLQLSLDAEDKKSPEKMLIKLTDKINEIEKQELLNLETQNMDMGFDLNQITFQILRREKELKFLEELYDTLQTEESLNQQEKVKLETTEAKLLKAYENLNRVEVEKKRLEQIFIVCQRNPAKNQEWIRNLESQVESMRKLVKYQELQIHQYKTEVEESGKQMVEIDSQMTEKRTLRNQAILKVSNIIEKKRQLDIKVAEVEDQRMQILKGMEGPEKTINKLKQRQIVYRKWIAKLQVTKAFVNEKKNYYEKSFRKITAVTGISNPNDIEGLLSFIERTNDLRKTKQTKERKMEQMKVEKARMEEELRNIQNGQPQYDHTDIEDVQNKVAVKEKNLRDLRGNTQRCLFQIADIKSGLLNVAKQTGVRNIDSLDTSNISMFVDRLSERFHLVQRKIQALQIKAGDFSMIIENDGDPEKDLERTVNNSILDSGREDRKIQMTSALGQGSTDEDHLNYTQSQEERKGMTLGGRLSSHGDVTPARKFRKKQPKQKHAHMSDHSNLNQNQQQQDSSNNSLQHNNNNNNAINSLFHYQKLEKAEDSESEERNQMKFDRLKVKQLLGILQNKPIVASNQIISKKIKQVGNNQNTNSLSNSYSFDQSSTQLNNLNFNTQSNSSQQLITINNQTKSLAKHGSTFKPNSSMLNPTNSASKLKSNQPLLDKKENSGSNNKERTLMFKKVKKGFQNEIASKIQEIQFQAVNNEGNKIDKLVFSTNNSQANIKNVKKPPQSVTSKLGNGEATPNEQKQQFNSLHIKNKQNSSSVSVSVSGIQSNGNGQKNEVIANVGKMIAVSTFAGRDKSADNAGQEQKGLNTFKKVAKEVQIIKLMKN